MVGAAADPERAAAVQRDFDGSPMNTDVMHDETCLEMARVLGERGEGFQELTLASWDPKKDADHFEKIAEVSGRPIMYEALATNDRFPHRHRNTMKWLERCRQKGLPVYGQGTTTDAGLTFTFEDWNLFDDSDAWREATTGTVADRTEKLGDPRRRAALKSADAAREPDHQLLRRDHHHRMLEAREQEVRRHDAAASREGNRQASGRHDARHRGVGGSQDRVLRTGGQPTSDLMKELIDYPYITFGVSDGGAHTKFLTAGRYPTEGLIVRAREELDHARRHPLAHVGLPAFCAGFKDRGFLREGAPADIVVYNLDN